MKPEAQLGNQQFGMQNAGHAGPQQLVFVNQTVIEPPCCGTLCVSINDFFWLWGPTGMSFYAAKGAGGFVAVYLVGFVAHILAVGAAICSCGLPSPGKLTYLNAYKWFRLVWFILYLVCAAIVVAIGIVIINDDSVNDQTNKLGDIFGAIIVALGVIIAIPGIVMASTHGCFSRDLNIKKSAVTHGTPAY